MDGILNVLKPPGMTSHDVINWVRRTLNEKKAGHIGTLDPGAAGVLPVFLGKGTKIIPFIDDEKKIYRAKIIFGKTTDTQDQFGKILETNTPNFTLLQFNEVLNTFNGKVVQKPSIYSAIKVKGKKLYEYARENKEVDIPEREIYIHDIKIIHHHIPYYAFIEVTCSKGTYIRSLCEDIGRSLNCGAYMGFLLRSNSGNFSLSSSYTLEEIEKEYNTKSIDDLILPMDFPFKDHLKLNIKESAKNSLMNGNAIFPQGIEEDMKNFEEGQVVSGYIDNKIVALGKIQHDIEYERLYFKPLRVLI